MRYVYITLISVLVVVALVFALQNGARVTVVFLSASATLPLAGLLALTYLAGMITGGSMLALVRNWIQGAKKRQD